MVSTPQALFRYKGTMSNLANLSHILTAGDKIERTYFLKHQTYPLLKGIMKTVPRSNPNFTTTFPFLQHKTVESFHDPS